MRKVTGQTDPYTAAPKPAVIPFGSVKGNLTIPLHIIFETEAFIVVSNNDTRNPCFEIVVLASDAHPVNHEAFLHGASAQYLFDCIKSWQVATPDQEQVEATLSSLAWCNVQLLGVH